MCRGVTILDESPFVIPDADPESIQTNFFVIIYFFTGNEEPESLGMRKA
jgi:hypothetical protein